MKNNTYFSQGFPETDTSWKGDQDTKSNSSQEPSFKQTSFSNSRRKIIGNTRQSQILQQSKKPTNSSSFSKDPFIATQTENTFFDSQDEQTTQQLSTRRGSLQSGQGIRGSFSNSRCENSNKDWWCFSQSSSPNKTHLSRSSETRFQPQQFSNNKNYQQQQHNYTQPQQEQSNPSASSSTPAPIGYSIPFRVGSPKQKRLFNNHSSNNASSQSHDQQSFEHSTATSTYPNRPKPQIQIGNTTTTATTTQQNLGFVPQSSSYVPKKQPTPLLPSSFNRQNLPPQSHLSNRSTGNSFIKIGKKMIKIINPYKNNNNNNNSHASVFTSNEESAAISAPTVLETEPLDAPTYGFEAITTNHHQYDENLPSAAFLPRRKSQQILLKKWNNILTTNQSSKDIRLETLANQFDSLSKPIPFLNPGIPQSDSDSNNTETNQQQQQPSLQPQLLNRFTLNQLINAQKQFSQSTTQNTFPPSAIMPEGKQSQLINHGMNVENCVTSVLNKDPQVIQIQLSTTVTTTTSKQRLIISKKDFTSKKQLLNPQQPFSSTKYPNQKTELIQVDSNLNMHSPPDLFEQDEINGFTILNGNLSNSSFASTIRDALHG